MKKTENNKISRRRFIGSVALSATAFSIVPRYVLGGTNYIAPSDKITMGFIGCGRQSGGLGKNFLKLQDIQMVACSDVDNQKLAIFKKMVEDVYAEKAGKSDFIGCEGYHEYEKIIDRDDIDAVIIALPDHWHAIPSIQAMKAGKDVYCEKPLSHTLKEGKEMVKTTRKYERVFQTGSMQRSWDSFRHACELVRNGYLGEIKTVKVNVGDPGIACDLPAEPVPEYLDWDRWLGPAQERPFNAILSPPHTARVWPKWRDYKEFGGGILCDWGAHMFDIAQWGLGMDGTTPVEWIPPEDPKAVRGLTMKYANGVVMTHEDFGRGWAVQFNGTEGKLEVSRQFLETDPVKIADQKIKNNEIRLYKNESHYQDFVDAIKSRKKPICDVEIGHSSASVCNIANIAYWLNKPLKWDPVKEKFDDKEANKLRGKKHRKPYKV